MASTRLRDPATGRFISAAAAAGVSVPAASPVVTEPDPSTKKDDKQDKRQGKKQSPKNKKNDKKKNHKNKKKKRKKG